jgi:hypothetical protein
LQGEGPGVSDQLVDDQLWVASGRASRRSRPATTRPGIDRP